MPVIECESEGAGSTHDRMRGKKTKTMEEEVESDFLMAERPGERVKVHVVMEDVVGESAASCASAG